MVVIISRVELGYLAGALFGLYPEIADPIDHEVTIRETGIGCPHKVGPICRARVREPFHCELDGTCCEYVRAHIRHHAFESEYTVSRRPRDRG